MLERITMDLFDDLVRTVGNGIPTWRILDFVVSQLFRFVDSTASIILVIIIIYLAKLYGEGSVPKLEKYAVKWKKSKYEIPMENRAWLMGIRKPIMADGNKETYQA